MSSNRRKTTDDTNRVVDEVEELLKATEDELLLDLTVGSHISKLAPSYIDSDLNRRFQALKKPSSAAVTAAFSSSSKPIDNSSSTNRKSVVDDVGGGGGDAADLLARFVALKGSRHEDLGQRIRNDQLEGDLSEDDEVEKIIQWAKDAARLDPSPPADSDDSDNFQPSDVEEDGEDSEEEKLQETKTPQKKKKAIKRGLLGLRR